MAEGVWSGGQVPHSDALRIGDAEREQTMEDLRAHTVAGRLTMDEYSERLDAVYSARTRGDLRPIMADLPLLAGPGPDGGDAGPFLGPVDRARPTTQGPTHRGHTHNDGAHHGHVHQGQPHRGPGARGGFGGSAWTVWLVVAIVLTVASHGLAWPVWVVGPIILSVGRGCRPSQWRRDPSADRR